MNKDKIQIAMTNAVYILDHYLDDFTSEFRGHSSINSFYGKTDNVDWTTGFNTGMYWLAYENTKDDKFKDAALIQVDSFLRRIENKIEVDHHDMGFLYSLSCVAADKLVDSEVGKRAALMAADQLMLRYHEKGEFIQAWGELGAKDNYRLIIDCLMNLPLLYWASEVTGDDKYKDVANKHINTSLKNLVRDDYSTYHTYFFDHKTGEPLYGATHQGYQNDSAWARGQSWGVYGLALSHRYTHNEKCIELFHNVTDYFINHLPEDNIAYWDLEFNDGSDEPKDSSASAIAACGMLEMCKYLPKEEAKYYYDKALTIAYSLIDNYAVKDVSKSNGLLLHGVYAKNSPYNPINKDRGVDECNIWGDYFYLELLSRLLDTTILYW